MRRLSLVAAFVAWSVSPLALVQKPQQPAQPTASTAPVVVFTMLKGVFEIETFPVDAPKSVARIVDLARHGFYRGQHFHWVQAGVAQVGDLLSRDMTKRADWGRGGSGSMGRRVPIGVAEICKRSFVRGMVGLAYQAGEKPEDADSQIFILKITSPALNGKYAAIGRVIKGMDVVDQIQVEDMIKDIAVR